MNNFLKNNSKYSRLSLYFIIALIIFIVITSFFYDHENFELNELDNNYNNKNNKHGNDSINENENKNENKNDGDKTGAESGEKFTNMNDRPTWTKPPYVHSGGWDRDTSHYQLLNPYNYTQTEFIKLNGVLNKMSNHAKKRLDNPIKYNELIPATTDGEILRELDIIMHPVIQRLNQLYSEKNYTSKFTRTDYDRIKFLYDKNNNLNMIVEVFVQEKQRYPYGVKLRLDLYKPNTVGDKMMSNNRIVRYLEHKDQSSRNPSYSLNNNVSQLDGKEVMPDSMQALSTPHWPILDTVNWTPPKPQRQNVEIFINSARIMNSTKIIYPDKYAPRVDGGINDTTLENSCYNNARNYRAEPNVIRNKWIPLADEPKNLKGYPCVPISTSWDKLGVKCPLKEQTRCCNGLRHSIVQAPLRAEFNPTIHTNPRNQGLYSWLFDLYTPDGGSTGRNF